MENCHGDMIIAELVQWHAQPLDKHHHEGAQGRPEQPTLESTVTAHKGVIPPQHRFVDWLNFPPNSPVPCFAETPPSPLTPLCSQCLSTPWGFLKPGYRRAGVCSGRGRPSFCRLAALLLQHGAFALCELHAPWMVVIRAAGTQYSGPWLRHLGGRMLRRPVELWVRWPTGLRQEPTAALDKCMGPPKCPCVFLIIHQRGAVA